jgi:hypothetical protein
MKVIAILFMLLGLGLIVVLGFAYLLGFAMSFDAPGSDKDAGAWGMRFLIFLPILLFIVVLVFALKAFVGGHYARSVGIGSIFVVAIIAFGGYTYVTSSRSLKAYQKERAREEELTRLYPKEKYLRPAGAVTDTIFVFPNGIVSYRYLSAPNFPLSGPLGDLNESRDTIIYYRSPHNDIKIEELDAFVDEKGRKITDVYAVR